MKSWILLASLILSSGINGNVDPSCDDGDEDCLREADSCLEECTRGSAYGLAFCAAVNSLLAPFTDLAMKILGLSPIFGSYVEGVLWGFSGYCGAGTPQRVCDFCGGGLGFSDILRHQEESFFIVRNYSNLELKEDQPETDFFPDETSDLPSTVQGSQVKDKIEVLYDLFNGINLDHHGSYNLEVFLSQGGPEGSLNLRFTIHKLRIIMLGGIFQNSVFRRNPQVYCQKRKLESLRRLVFISRQMMIFMRPESRERLTQIFTTDQELMNKEMLRFCRNLTQTP